MANLKKIDIRGLLDVAVLLGTAISMYYVVGQLMEYSSRGGAGGAGSDKRAKNRSAVLKLLNDHPGIELDEYETQIVQSLIAPEDINVGFDDIAGLDNIISDLKESVILPLTIPELYNHHAGLLKAPKGVLLHGPPGCGKTMLAKALAKQSKANFINVQMSDILDKWFGESNKLVSAIFSLAKKLEPCIIFIDEIDSFLRQRGGGDHEVTSMLKAEFMTLWDGLTSDGRVLVLGATNRPTEIDSAFLRRLPKRFGINLPTRVQRQKILELLLKDVELEEGKFDWDYLIDNTEGMSGSDLKEICRNAAMVSMREYIRDHVTDNILDGERPMDKVVLRPLKTTDFFSKSATSDNILPFNEIMVVGQPSSVDQSVD